MLQVTELSAQVRTELSETDEQGLVSWSEILEFPDHATLTEFALLCNTYCQYWQLTGNKVSAIKALRSHARSLGVTAERKRKDEARDINISLKAAKLLVEYSWPEEL